MSSSRCVDICHKMSKKYVNNLSKIIKNFSKFVKHCPNCQNLSQRVTICQEYVKDCLNASKCVDDLLWIVVKIVKNLPKLAKVYLSGICQYCWLILPIEIFIANLNR